MSLKNVTKTEITRTFDSETAEIIEDVKINTFAIDREPQYVKLYIEDIVRLKNLPKGMTKILFEVVKGMGYNGVIMAYKPIKEMMCVNMGIGLDWLNKCIDTFYKQGILIRVKRGVYLADPNLFGKGKWSNIKNLRLVIEYKKDGTKKLKSNVSEEMKKQLELEF